MATVTEPSPATETARKRYNRAARFYDLHQAVAEQLIFRRLRSQLWTKAPAAGRILEVGVGTGVNISCYPDGARVTAIDISDQMLARAKHRAERLNAAVDLALMDAQHLDFPDATFDAAVATCVFCSVPDPVAGLREAWRVLKPGGKLLLLDHVRSGNPVLGKLMDVVNPLMVRMSGANINRRTLENLRRAGVQDFDASSHAFGIVKLTEARKPTTEAR
ncbi:MAG: class I SAM-dependent methyltransferase [Chloroflexi bacterium]|nr:class I SAM-dependent methyltransferase [Chloroflexota bacterium]